ncbi:hypothetical protein M408DRAFT_321321 [Serendipita vermifera MAFF 305830]|uniref:Protein kinase domain-containing protein n=1 Tax=Serendipita vermifera MAFF 305830 TaxID=933852 RepID=A0A0C2X131_SERVB|nr:hypothetical protein M408DRAFT_321321 [Serendipita vermifera MAFF 305830]
MDPVNSIASHFNLTGYVTILSHMPDSMGNFSCVFRGSLNGHLVAIKIIKATTRPESMRRKVLRERAVWASTDHPNIHLFYGYADDPSFGPFGVLISPWCAHGDASKFLEERGESIIFAERLELWKGIIEGVVYLHGCSPAIIHGDLKPGNVLIDDNGRPRLCDFGLARVFLEEGSTGMTTTSEHTGTTRYLAPELVFGDELVHSTTASDAYAVGCLGLEVKGFRSLGCANLLSRSYFLKSLMLVTLTTCEGKSSEILELADLPQVHRPNENGHRIDYGG